MPTKADVQSAIEATATASTNLPPTDREPVSARRRIASSAAPAASASTGVAGARYRRN
jgi:hypothetical protein